MEICKLLKNIDDKKATRTDKIPPKLIKRSAAVLSKPLAEVIDNSIYKKKEKYRQAMKEKLKLSFKNGRKLFF